MKFYVQLDRHDFVIEAESELHAIAELWERRADTCRNLDDVLPNYWCHLGRSEFGVNVDSLGAFWLLSPTAQFTIRSVLKSQMDEATFQDCCEIILSHHHHPDKE